tara:strand:- start:114 stop:320 length:207 start_codon:yes stop_codon:yes gene_type:complete
MAPDNAIGRLSRMEAISAQGLSEVGLQKAEVRLRKLLAPLTRIDDEDFVTCYGFDLPIPPKLWNRYPS